MNGGAPQKDYRLDNEFRNDELVVVLANEEPLGAAKQGPDDQCVDYEYQVLVQKHVEVIHVDEAGHEISYEHDRGVVARAVPPLIPGISHQNQLVH